MPEQRAARKNFMAISVLQLFTIGIGPSSSHTVGPMRAAGKFLEHLAESGVSGQAESVTAHLYGSLAMTGRGHGTDRAVMLGLEGETPEGVNVESIAGNLERIHASGRLRLGGRRAVNFLPARNLVFHRGESLPAHPNGMRFVACDATGREIANQVFYSMGGGFVVRGDDVNNALLPSDDQPLPFPFASGADMLRMATGSGLGVSEMTLRNEAIWRPESETRSALLKVWHAMRDCVDRGWRRGDKVHWQKNLGPEEVGQLIGKLDGELVIHFRWASVGGVQPQLCHPFPVDRVSSTKLEGKAARLLFHNGTWSGHKSALEFVEAKQKRKVGGPLSDSRVIALLVDHLRDNSVLQHIDGRFVLYSAKTTKLYGDWRTWGVHSAAYSCPRT